ncbi:beta-1,4-galactosyltransferase 4-like [Diadema setosum]|uniref:beta-1,4-galactosyltransferase 4-like n=1 Tax=Diadema setosum TaxID=31175 RepID=UPI003B3AA6B9
MGSPLQWRILAWAHRAVKALPLHGIPGSAAALCVQLTSGELKGEISGVIVVSYCNGSREMTVKQGFPKCTLGSPEDLNSRYEVNISSIDMSVIEDIVFGELKGFAEMYVDQVASKMMAASAVGGTPYYKNNTEFRDADSKSLLIGNYTYLAGGRWRPRYCRPQGKVAIVIPYRDRAEHLAILLRNLLQVLTLQNLEFGIFVAEQANDGTFNRGLMKNIGYLEATNFGDWDCVIFHDIDQVPMRATASYGCENMPRHLCAYPEEMGFKLMYGAIFGGVVGASAEQMRQSNGYSNVYWGWGGEDDDIRARLHKMKYKIYRDTTDGYFKTLQHKKKTADQICKERICFLRHFSKRMHWDGLSSVRYRANVTLNLLYTHIAVDAKKETWNTYECKNKK